MCLPKPDERSSPDETSRAWLEQSDADPRQLAGLFRREKKLFSTTDLGQMLTHQLASPLQFHWVELNTRLALELTALTSEDRSCLTTFGDLLRHAHPPAALLLLLKDYAKAMLKHPDDLLPQKLASVLYFTAIAAAKVQGLEKITELDKVGIHKGIEWALEQPWVGEPCRAVLEKGLAQMKSSGVRMR